MSDQSDDLTYVSTPFDKRPVPTVTVHVYEEREGVDYLTQQPDNFAATSCRVLDNGDLVVENVRTPIRLGELAGDLLVPHGKWRKVELSPIRRDSGG
jgi:hypothetical protein